MTAHCRARTVVLRHIMRHQRAKLEFTQMNPAPFGRSVPAALHTRLLRQFGKSTVPDRLSRHGCLRCFAQWRRQINLQSTEIGAHGKTRRGMRQRVYLDSVGAAPVKRCAKALSGPCVASRSAEAENVPSKLNSVEPSGFFPPAPVIAPPRKYARAC